MLKMLAAALEDGWAFVRRGRDILLVKPPYLQSDLLAVSEGTVERAIARHGFVSVEEQFQNWADLITFLKAQLLATRRDLGLTEPRTDVIRELIGFAPSYMLKSYLDRIKNELIPLKEWQACLDLLTAIMRVEAVRVNRELHRYALNVLENCQQQMHATEIKRQELIDEEHDLVQQFPNTIQKYGATEIIAAVNNVQRTRSLWS
jgi:hypothetical protein